MNHIKKPVIGVVGTPIVDDENDSAFAVFNDYHHVLVAKDCFPFVINPLTNIDYVNTRLSQLPDLSEREKRQYNEMLSLCDGVLLQGGYRMYGFQNYLAEMALERDIPIMGICLGMQQLVTADTGNFNLDLIETGLNHGQPESTYVHKINIADQTRLREIVKQEQIAVNSMHRRRIQYTNDFVISAYSEDGVPEAVEHPDKRFALGVQWHPERMISYDEPANLLFEEFKKESEYTKMLRISK